MRTTIPDVSAPPLPDLVRRDFSVGDPGRRTCGDITYVDRVPAQLPGHRVAHESFWATLKRELVSRFRFATRNQARHAITAWITHYNATRLHSSLQNVPPIEWELNYRLAALRAA